MKEKKNLDSLENKVLDFINKEELLKPNDSILIGISGGSDSFALTEILFQLSFLFSWKITLAYVEHFVREDTEIEKKLIKKYAEERNLPCYFLEISKKSLKEKELREERYRALKNLAEEKEINKIALGHTLDDQIETIIMNFLKGLGTRGLVGIPIKREKFIRPLLCASKEEIISYCQRKNLVYHDDFTNFLPITLRNKIRWQLIPFLKEISPFFPESILTQRKIAEEEEKFLEDAFQKYFASNVERENKIFKIDLPSWKDLPIAIKIRVLSFIFNEFEKILPFKTLLKVIRNIDSKDGFVGKIDFIEIYKFKDKIIIKPEENEINYSLVLKIPGKVKLPTGEIITAEVLDKKSVQNINFQNPFQVYFDYDKIDLEELKIRPWKEGDRFKPFGLGGKAKKLQDFFVDKKIPRFKRKKIPLIFGKEELLWIVGIGRSDIAKIDENTKRIIFIKAEKEVED